VLEQVILPVKTTHQVNNTAPHGRDEGCNANAAMASYLGCLFEFVRSQ
jgi:hypothetical protein